MLHISERELDLPKVISGGLAKTLEKNKEKKKMMNKEWNLDKRNSGHMREYLKNYREKNKKGLNEMYKEWKIRNAISAKESRRKWLEKNPDYYKNYSRQYYLKNKDRIRVMEGNG